MDDPKLLPPPDNLAEMTGSDMKHPSFPETVRPEDRFPQPNASSVAAAPSVPLALTERLPLTLLLLICSASAAACWIFCRVVRCCNAQRTAFNGLLLARAAVLQVNLAAEMALLVLMLQQWWVPRPDVCFTLSLISAVCAFAITFLTSWLSLVRLLLLAVARWAPRHGWRVTNIRVYLIILLLFVPSAAFFVKRYEPTIFFYMCSSLPIRSPSMGSPNTTALGVLFLISIAANTILLYADATLPPAPPRRRNVLSARRFALFTLCEQMLVMLWMPATALTAGITRALLIRVLMISQAGLLDTLGLILVSPQLRAALLGRRRPREELLRTQKVAPVPIIRLELI